MRLTAHDLCCHAGAFTLRGVSLELEPGGRLALIGPNGAGKSTLLRALCGRLPAQGRVELDGRPLETLGARRRARALCLLPQSEEGAAAFTVEDYVRLGRFPHLGLFGSYSPRDRQVAEEAMARAGCAAWRHRLLPTLSGGERQLVRLAAALAQEARILLLDEPGTFLDPGQRRRLWERLEAALDEGGLSLVFVSHDLNEALRHARRYLALREGRVLRQGPVEELARVDWLEPLYGLGFQALEATGHAQPWLVERP